MNQSTKKAWAVQTKFKNSKIILAKVTSAPASTRSAHHQSKRSLGAELFALAVIAAYIILARNGLIQ